MQKKLILKRLQHTIFKANLLKTWEFSFDNFRVEYLFPKDSKHDTVKIKPLSGDFIEWYPIWFPKSEFDYQVQNSYVVVTYEGSSKREDIVSGLCEWHGLSKTIIGCLFFGEILIINANKPNKTVFKSFNTISRVQLIKRFEAMYRRIDQNLIDPNWTNNLKA
ncbi:hypothetical protein LV89_03826 [Arcicella aurantiaca]|uniref:Uncharacterized protein n=1 Tax=Arcicella aurantiaca TaxID=591202 RepID=A0A316DUN3_9BACT|nr:hypothetical protein [Arcicella aurantiaca]PWK20283.1 hypothetical protein LV89_03826 [Arcicella aurantiaca]